MTRVGALVRRVRPAVAASMDRTSLAVGAIAAGTIAVGAVAIGAMVIGRLRIRRLRVDDARVGRLRVGTLEVDRLVLRGPDGEEHTFTRDGFGPAGGAS